LASHGIIGIVAVFVDIVLKLGSHEGRVNWMNISFWRSLLQWVGVLSVKIQVKWSMTIWEFLSSAESLLKIVRSVECVEVRSAPSRLSHTSLPVFIICCCANYEDLRSDVTGCL
jgi:hypothetical protein